MTNSRRADYVVIGAGSAGCAIAAKLSEDPETSVVLLEAGGPDRSWDVRLQMPAAMGLAAFSPQLTWQYHTEPQARLDGRRIPCPRGRVLGGSSAVNGMAFVRGHPLDFDRWAQDPALQYWRYAEVLPYFRRLEAFSGGSDAYRGGDGPVHVQRARGWNALYGTFIEAGRQAGYPVTEDMNGYQQEGFGWMDMTVRDGRRVSTANAYLHPARGRPNLTVVTGATVARLLLEGKRCIGVAYRRHGRDHQLRAEREIVLAAGAIGSPHLLMLSGIGDADELRTVGVEPRHALPGVGRNLQDHVEIFVKRRCRQSITLVPMAKPLNRIPVGLRWLATRTGWGAINHMEAGAFIRSHADMPWPDVQCIFMPRAFNTDGSSAPEVQGFQGHLSTQRSRSRGHVRLRSDRVDDAPLIDPNYMAHVEDWEDMRRSIRIVREIFEQPAFASYLGEELEPGGDAVSDGALDDFIRRTATTSYHPCGTCKMGSDPLAVVDGELKVHGLEGLRVADSSIMPTIVSANLNAPTIMIGEKAADLLRGRHLPAADVAVYTSDLSRQR